MTDGRLDRGALVRQLLEQHAWSCALPLAERAVHQRSPAEMSRCQLDADVAAAASSGGPLVTVAVCSRTPAAQLQPCLDSLIALEYAPLDLVLIDASDDRTRVEALVRDHYPTIRYSCAPGAGAAPRRAVSECRGDVLALTHGDAVVDRRWVSRLVAVFLADPEVMTVTGLTLPRSIERPMRAGCPPVRRSAASGRAWAWTGVRRIGSMQKVLERAGVNVAFWQPGSSVTATVYARLRACRDRSCAASSSCSGQPRRRRVPLTQQHGSNRGSRSGPAADHRCRQPPTTSA